MLHKNTSQYKMFIVSEAGLFGHLKKVVRCVSFCIYFHQFLGLAVDSVVFLGKTLYSHSAVSTQVYKWVPENLKAGGNPTMD